MTEKNQTEAGLVDDDATDDLHSALAKIGACVVYDAHGAVMVACSKDRRMAAYEIMNDHGIITSLPDVELDPPIDGADRLD